MGAHKAAHSGRIKRQSEGKGFTKIPGQCSMESSGFSGAEQHGRIFLNGIGPDFQDGNQLQNVTLLNITPTAAKTMGFEPAWEWEGKAAFQRSCEEEVS